MLVISYRAMSSSKQLISDVDEYGFERDEAEREFKSRYYNILTRRSLRWNKVFSSRLERSRTLQRFIRKGELNCFLMTHRFDLVIPGIPLSLRNSVWMSVSGSQRSMDQSPTLYSDLLRSQYQAEIVETIKIDIPRTFPENIYFEIHKNELFNVLVAFAHQNSAVGYCQGLNYIGGLILIVTKDEHVTFWLLKHLVERVASEYHTKNMSGLQLDIHVIGELIKLREPLIDEKINEVGLPWAVILTKWLICLYAETLPVETVLRIWDVMFAEGYKIIFRVALAIVLILKEDIMKATDISELAELFRNVNKHPRMLDCHSFLEFMFKIKLKRRDIDVLRNNYRR